MAEAGIEPAAKRRCAVCAAVIPAWRKGRKVSSATRFCSPKCSRRAKRLTDTQNAVFDIETVKEGL